MNGLIKPVIQPNIGNLILQGLGAAQQFGQMQRGMEVRSLGEEAQTDPEAFKRLAALDPSRARQLRLMQDEEEQRFRRERAFTANQIEGLPPEQQINVLDARIDMINKRGGDASNTQGLRDMLASGDPAEMARAGQIISMARTQGQQEGFLKGGAQQKPTSLAQNLMAAGFQPGTPEYHKAMREILMKPATQISVGETGAAAEQKELGKIRAKELVGVRDRANLAQNNLASLDILDNIDVSTGRAEPMKQALAAWGKSFGLNTAGLANVPAGQAFTAEAAKTVLNAMQAQKGPQTESDMRQIRTTVATLQKDPKANQFINNSARALSLRSIEQRDFYDNYLSEKGSLKGVSKARNDQKRDVPMVSQGLKTPDGLPVFYFQFETQ